MKGVRADMAGRKRIFRCAAGLLLAAFCRISADAAVDSHIVTGVDVVYRQAQSGLQRHYTTQENMQAVLTYLRLAKYAGLPEEDPTAQGGEVCRITVHLAPGDSHVYDLINDVYLSRNGGPWELAEFPEPRLPLLRRMPSDP